MTRYLPLGGLFLVMLVLACLAVARVPAQDPPADASEHPFPRHVPAPSLDGGTDWLNAAGPIDLKDLRGKFVLLDFWTYCCINCMHILPELKKLEHAYPNELVVIGVHSAKFATEQDTKNIAEAVERYEIEHPVVNDANHVIWDKFYVNSWPSLRLIDPEGNFVGGHGGEIEFEALDQVLRNALPYYRQKKLLDPTPLHFDLESARAKATPLRFPGKVLADESGNRLFVSDSNHNRIVVADLAGKLIDVIGSGALGAEDGTFEKASFDHPQGMALAGETLYVADTENHLLRKVDLAKRRVKTIAGIGKQGRNPWPGLETEETEEGVTQVLPKRFVGRPDRTALNSPWALWIQGKALYIAMAGPHQIWRMPLDESEMGPFAGNGREDIVDGPLLPKEPYAEGFASFAQPSGLSSDGQRLFVADSEGSSIRAVPFDDKGEVTTLVGTAKLPAARLFTFGDVDGPASKARLQHPLDVVYYRDRLYVADTYNNKIKEIDPKSGEVKSLVGTGKAGASDEPASFDEPEGIAAAAGKLYVADTNNHLIRTVELDGAPRVATLVIEGLTPPQPPTTEVANPFAQVERKKQKQADLQVVDGTLRIAVQLDLPKGFKINPLAPMAYRLDVKSTSAPVGREGLGKSIRLDEPNQKFEIQLPVTAEMGEADLEVALAYYYCKEGAEGLCKAKTVGWKLPLRWSPKNSLQSAQLSDRAE